MTNTVKTYKDIDKTLLKSILSPTQQGLEIKIKIPECTFLGVMQQPDFAVFYLAFYPLKKVIELKSLKEYIYQLRGIVVSYERLIEVVYQHIMVVYEPDRFRIVMICSPRGGISSKLTIDSDWASRGGKEKYRDWVGMDDAWSIAM